MTKLRVHNLAMSVDGYVAGPDQSPDNPLGVGGTELHDWAVATASWRRQHGMDGGESGSVDDDFIARGDDNIGATIMGRNMFGPERGPWGDDPWRGWWGDDPPFHHSVFVLTHHERPPLEMDGGTTFVFVTDGIESALEQAAAAAAGADVRLGGGAAAVRQYLSAGLIDSLHAAVVPILLRSGERLFDGPGVLPDGYECVEFTPSSSVAHVVLARR